MATPQSVSGWEKWKPLGNLLLLLQKKKDENLNKEVKAAPILNLKSLMGPKKEVIPEKSENI